MIKPDEFIQTPLLKRLVDVGVSLILTVVLAPFLLLFLIALLIEGLSPRARGPLFYCEDRISGGKIFKLCKIRTCWQDVYDQALSQDGFIHTIEIEKNRANFLRVGWWLKKIYLDESPQLWSVLRGDLSLVGPRPANLVNYKKLLAQGIYTKTAIKSGLTGYFQAYKGHADQRTDVEMDTEYIEYCRSHTAWAILWWDFKIIFLTLLTVLEHKGI